MWNTPRHLKHIGLCLLMSTLSLGLSGCQTQPTTATEAESTSSPSTSAAKPAPAAGPYVDFGDPMRGQPQDAIAADMVLASLSDYQGQTVRVRGVVKEVCPKRGCWMRVGGQTETQTIFVKFTCPIEGRLIPLNAVNLPVVVEGTLQQAKVSEAMARHYAKDSGATPEQIAAIKGPQPMLRMSSASVRVEGLEDSLPTSE